MRALAALQALLGLAEVGRRSSRSEGRPAGTSTAPGAAGTPRSMRASKTARGLRPAGAPARPPAPCGCCSICGSSASAPAHVGLDLAQLELGDDAGVEAQLLHLETLAPALERAQRDLAAGVERAQVEVAARHLAHERGADRVAPGLGGGEVRARRLAWRGGTCPRSRSPSDARSTSRLVLVSIDSRRRREDALLGGPVARARCPRCRRAGSWSARVITNCARACSMRCGRGGAGRGWRRAPRRPARRAPDR